MAKQKKVLEQEEKTILHTISDLKEGDPFADPDHASDNAAVDTDVREQVGHDTVVAEIAVLEKRLKDIKIALTRIQKKRYGTCEKCNKTIPQGRLDLVPEARFCIECERLMRK